jgi:hypothetical protein
MPYLLVKVVEIPSQLKSDTMKNVIACLATALMLATFNPVQARPGRNTISISAFEKTEKEATELEALLARLNEIEAMDPSTMNRLERKEIRKELHSIEKEVALHSSTSVYISGGLLLLIIVGTFFLSIPEKIQLLDPNY